MGAASSHAYIGSDNPKTIDSNVIEIPLSYLDKITSLATGDPLLCTNCRCALNSFSQFVRTDQGVRWQCEFCDSVNLLQAEDEELPEQPELTYLLEGLSQVAEKRQGHDDTSTAIFCVDTSGSMCVTSPVQGSLNLKTNKQQEFLRLLEAGDNREIEKNITYVSRMECVQAAIEQQLREMKVATPSKKVGLVTFNREVTILGDGRTQQVLTGDKLNNPDALRQAVQGQHHHFLQRTVGENAENLTQKVLELQEDGPTALGPALFVSTFLAVEGGPGSKVVLCTDGLANIGVGNFETLSDSAPAFYQELGTFASSKGVVLSVISLEGEECKLESLAPLTELTGGFLLKVSPATLTAEFNNILSDEVIATQVSVTITLHRAMRFRNEAAGDLSWNDSRLVKMVGNATQNSSFSFEYCLKSKDELAAENVDLDALENITMQALFEYCTLDGRKCLRCVTRVQPVTRNLKKARKGSKFDMLMRNFNRQNNKMVKKGKFSSAKQLMQEWEGEVLEQAEREEHKEAFRDYEEYKQDLGEVIAKQEVMEREMGLEIDEDDENALELRKEQFLDAMSHAARRDFSSEKR